MRFCSMELRFRGRSRLRCCILRLRCWKWTPHGNRYSRKDQAMVRLLSFPPFLYFRLLLTSVGGTLFPLDLLREETTHQMTLRTTMEPFQLPNSTHSRDRKLRKSRLLPLNKYKRRPPLLLKNKKLLLLFKRQLPLLILMRRVSLVSTNNTPSSVTTRLLDRLSVSKKSMSVV